MLVSHSLHILSAMVYYKKNKFGVHLCKRQCASYDFILCKEIAKDMNAEDMIKMDAVYVTESRQQGKLYINQRISTPDLFRIALSAILSY